MSPALTQEMIDGQDDMAGLLLPPQPAFSFVTTGIKHGRQPKPAKLFKGLATVRSHGISITGAAQGQADADRRDAIRRAIS